MDDGFQNPTLQKDFSIIVINGEQGFGNKRVIPSGPLRESISRGISRANLVVVIGEIAQDVKDKIPSTVPIIHAKFQISINNKIYKNQKVTAFAGIAYPEKFYNSLSEQGAILEKKISYPDHHIFDENDMLNLAENANLTKSVLVTTKKDFVRIPKSYRSLVSTLNGEIKFEDENLLKEILSNVLENKINDLAI
jgi:tetraacyldisaccharide 4'-kinase